MQPGMDVDRTYPNYTPLSDYTLRSLPQLTAMQKLTEVWMLFYAYLVLLVVWSSCHVAPCVASSQSH
jgi:hypothetical protein